MDERIEENPKAWIERRDPASDEVVIVEMPVSFGLLQPPRDGNARRAIIESVGEAVYNAAERCLSKRERERAQ